MIRLLSFILLSLFFKCVFAACGGTDHVKPLAVIADNAEDLLHKREFKQLDQLVVEYRDKNSVALDGQPKLMGFYEGLSKSASTCGRAIESDEQWNSHKQLLLDWSKKSTVTEAPRLALAMYEAALGWRARGRGYASTVTEADWAAFRQRMNNARAMLEEIKPKASKDPQWYAAMLGIGVAQGWTNEEFDALYQKAIKKFPHYFEYYFRKGQFYSAKWHGSQEKFKAFVEESVAATEPQFGQTMYARLNWSASNSSMFKDGQTDWPRMKKGFEKLMQDFPDSWNRNNFAKFSCMAGDKATLRQQMELIGKDVIAAAWTGALSYQACKHIAYETN